MAKSDFLNEKHGSGGSAFRDAAVPLLVITAMTLLAFANAWPNSLVLDDKAFAGAERPHNLDSLLYIFTHDAWSAVGIPSSLYRPLLLLGLSFESWVFGDWLPGYHLSNIFQHLLVTFLAYGLLRHLLSMNGGQTASANLCALLAALVFAVHPVHTEVVNSIFNRSEIMVAMFGVAGLWWLLHYLESKPARAWAGLSIVYFLALLSKENAIIIPALAVIFIVLPAMDNNLTTRIRKCLPVFWLLLPLACYLALRAQALDHPGLAVASQASNGEKAVTMLQLFTLPDTGDLITLAGFLGQSIKVTLWPYPLFLYHERVSTPESMYYLAIQLILIIAALILLARKRYSLACGLAFFYVAMLPASRIFDAASTGLILAERYLYFPSIGLAIMLAFALRALVVRFGARVTVNLGLPVLLIFTILTWDRNAEWASDVALYEAEYQRGYRGAHTLRLLTSTHLRAKNYSRVVRICDENHENRYLFPRNPYFYYCAVAYEHQNRIKEAENAYLLQIQHKLIRIDASLALARFYIRQKRRHDAEKYFLAAVNWSDDPADKALYMGEMISSLNPGSREQVVMARDYVREALRLHPGWRKAEILLARLDHALNAFGAVTTTEDAPQSN